MDIKRKFSRTLEEEKGGFLAFIGRTVGKITTLNEENIHDMPKGGMLVCCTHRSHLDYVIIGLKITEFGADQIRFAAGDNLTRIPVLGKLFRSVGAFSVYRGKSSQRAYIMRLAQQVKLMVASGDTIIVFPESGRSYCGRMLEVKSGVLASGILAQKDNPQKDIYYLPTAINYTRLPDLRAFDLLLKGKTMRDESKNIFVRLIGNFLYYFADVKVFLGAWIFKIKTDAIINIGKPTKLSEITDIEGNFRADAKSSIIANRDSISDCSQWVGKQLASLFPILPINVAAYLLDSFGESGCNEENFAKTVKQLKELGLYVGLLEAKPDKDIIKDGIKALKKNGALKVKSRMKYLADFISSYLDGKGE